jgi:hypothetical protein
MSFSKSRARPGMNEDRTGRRIFIESGKWVVSEQNAVFFTGAKLLQARAARTITGGKLHMGRMPILWRLQRATDLLSKCVIDGYYTKSSQAILLCGADCAVSKRVRPGWISNTPQLAFKIIC